MSKMSETLIGNSPLVITPDHSKDLTMSQLPQSPRPNIDKHTESIGGLDQVLPVIHVPVSILVSGHGISFCQCYHFAIFSFNSGVLNGVSPRWMTGPEEVIEGIVIEGEVIEGEVIEGGSY